MARNKKKITLWLNKIPSIGILCYFLLFVFSTTLYPGGSQADLNSQGFDWANNYWCNLMNEKGDNGVLNPARPYAISAMIILCSSLMVFFIQFAELYSKNLFWKRSIKWGGVLSMFFAILMFTKYHDLMTMVSSLFGLFAVLGLLKEIYQNNLTKYKIYGLIGLFLLGLNNYIYYTQQWLEYLPILQKATLLMVLIWVLGLNYELRKSIKNNTQKYKDVG